MSINFGSTAITDLKLGTASVSAVYLGSTKVWPPFTPVLRIYTSGVSATETAPAGATNVEIRAVGRGGAGGAGKPTPGGTQGGGGGGGGYSQSSYAIAGGDTLTYTVNSSGSTVSSGTKSITTMSAGTGGNGATATDSTGGLGGTGGVASGGNASNVSGATGSQGAPDGLGGGGAAGGALRTVGLYGRGADGSFTTSTNTSFDSAAVEFYYT